MASEGGLSPAGRVLPFLPEGALLDDPPLRLAASRPPWSAQLRYGVLSEVGSWNPERALERALARPTLAARLERALGGVGFDHFEVRRFLSLRRHLVLSAASAPALEAMTDRLAGHLARYRALELADVAFTLQTGRRELPHRRMLVCRGAAEAREALVSRDPHTVFSGIVGEGPQWWPVRPHDDR